MGRHKNATKGGSDAQKGISPTLSYPVGEAGHTGDVVHDLRDEVASLEDTQLQIGTCSKNALPLCVMQQIAIWTIFITWALTK